MGASRSPGCGRLCGLCQRLSVRAGPDDGDHHSLGLDGDQLLAGAGAHLLYHHRSVRCGRRLEPAFVAGDRHTPGGRVRADHAHARHHRRGRRGDRAGCVRRSYRRCHPHGVPVRRRVAGRSRCRLHRRPLGDADAARRAGIARHLGDRYDVRRRLHGDARRLWRRRAGDARRAGAGGGASLCVDGDAGRDQPVRGSSGDCDDLGDRL